MLDVVWQYIIAVIQRWYTLVTGVLFTLDQLLRWIWPKGKTWLDSKWPVESRRPIEIGALVVLLAVAGFETYVSERQARQVSDAALATVRADNRSLREQLASANVAAKAPQDHPAQHDPVVRAPPKPAALKRLIAYEAPRLDSTVVQNGDAANYYMQVATMQIRNVGDDTISLMVTKFDIYLDDKLSYRSNIGTSTTIVQQTQAAMFQARPPVPGIVLTPSNKYVRIELTIEYDTTPKTGRRTSERTFLYPVDFANGPKSAPLLNSSGTTRQVER